VSPPPVQAGPTKVSILATPPPVPPRTRPQIELTASAVCGASLVHRLVHSAPIGQAPSCLRPKEDAKGPQLPPKSPIRAVGQTPPAAAPSIGLPDRPQSRLSEQTAVRPLLGLRPGLPPGHPYSGSQHSTLSAPGLRSRILPDQAKRLTRRVNKVSVGAVHRAGPNSSRSTPASFSSNSATPTNPVCMAASWPWRPCREEFGPAKRIQRQPAPDPRTHQGKGPHALGGDGTQLRHCFTTGGVSLANAERLHEQEPPKRSWAWRSCPIRPASANRCGTRANQTGRRCGSSAATSSPGPWPGPSRAAPHTRAARKFLRASADRSPRVIVGKGQDPVRGPAGAVLATVAGRAVSGRSPQGRHSPNPGNSQLGWGRSGREWSAAGVAGKPRRMGGTRPGVLGMPAAPAVRATAQSALPSISALGA